MLVKADCMGEVWRSFTRCRCISCQLCVRGEEFGDNYSPFTITHRCTRNLQSEQVKRHKNRQPAWAPQYFATQFQPGIGCKPIQHRRRGFRIAYASISPRHLTALQHPETRSVRRVPIYPALIQGPGYAICLIGGAPQTEDLELVAGFLHAYALACLLGSLNWAGLVLLPVSIYPGSGCDP
ncbi:hypothetical protein A0H81_14264 [Grifola frondosa]|uniref:Uncharacterized protein n=1 Tax=Grifola frondosa TaxID=5627 RepID=A0A1C7LLP7_GRIFR|nr:hypothetical protein A0H81_14264 [Grifola frondosa]